jgi:hypothetical protein
MLQNVTRSLRLGQILWDDLSNTKWTRSGTYNVKNLNISGSLNTVARELAKYSSDLEVQGVRWYKAGIESAEDCNFFLGERK